MLKKIFCWALIIPGLFFALCGVLAVGGGASFSVMGKLLMPAMILVNIDWRMRKNWNQ